MRSDYPIFAKMQCFFRQKTCLFEQGLFQCRIKGEDLCPYGYTVNGMKMVFFELRFDHDKEPPRHFAAQNATPPQEGN
jgi:hypothetical protein